MKQITIHIKNKEKADLLLQSFRSLDFVENVKVENLVEAEESESEFFAMAGIWQGSNISQESLRQKAWH